MGDFRTVMGGMGGADKMSIDDKAKSDDDTKVLVKRICPSFVYYGKQLWGAHIYMTDDASRQQRELYCPTHWEIKQRYDKQQQEGV